ncbi:hypothetical protein IWW37_001773 [Coemansia sp. RSA 2050]|nr:hypothetical protein IWW37_001773 [Coemansia sp. RSA 2050]KAJ2735291.1 hypothetical protein IW152_001671 [Coemansia sp. BCRC 34962]
MKLCFSNRLVGIAGILSALALTLHAAQAEMAQLAVTSGSDIVPTTANAYAYHWWDAFANNAAGLVNFKAGDTSSLLRHKQHGMVESDKHITSDAAERAGKLSHVAKQGVGGIKQQAGKDARQAAKRVKHVGQMVHTGVPANEGRLALSVESTNNVIRNRGKWLRSVYGQLTGHIEALGSATRGASSQLRSKLRMGLSKLNDLASTDVVSTWLESMVAGSDKEVIMQYIQDLYQVSQQAHAQLEAKLEAQGAVLKSIADSYMHKQLPVAGLYGPLTAFMLVYLVSTIWSHRADMSHRIRQLTEAATADAGTTRLLQQEGVSAMEAIVAMSVHLAIVPTVTALLVVMELNGSPGWLVISSYTCLFASMLVAANPALLAGIWPGDDMGNAEHRLATGIAMFVAVSCFAQTVHG